MAPKDSTVITLRNRQPDVSSIEMHPDYWCWKKAFETLTGWPPEPVTTSELRDELANYFPAEALKDRTPQEAVPIEKAREIGILHHNPTNGTDQLATIETIDLEIGGLVLISKIPDQIKSESENNVSEERI